LPLAVPLSRLRGLDSSGQVLWSFAGDGGLISAPVVVNQTIYIASGQQIWSTQVGAPIFHILTKGPLA
jgi:outer membrane protein assembly factor BamB